jgi:hypothetical protein
MQKVVMRAFLPIDQPFTVELIDHRGQQGHRKLRAHYHVLFFRERVFEHGSLVAAAPWQWKIASLICALPGHRRRTRTFRIS